MNKTQKKNKKKSPKKLGMGLSSLLSTDEGLASVVKAKIRAKVNPGSNDIKSKTTLSSLNIIIFPLEKMTSELSH